MKATLLLVLRVLAVILGLALVAGLVYGLVFVLLWPWWVGLIVLCGLVGALSGLLFLRKLWLRRRERQFVDQIIAQDEARLQSLRQNERDQAKELQDRWKEAIQALRSSHLKRLGNPLYVLPWYLVIGESGSGKTTAIRSARLASPFTQVSRTSGIAGTRNCDWWFFEQAVIIDTAGRYAIPVDEGQDKKEWQRFLSLLVKFRKKEALNGLVVTIAADKLLRADPAELEGDGVSIRRRIDELMLALGSRFPVYVMVTKCDLIQGLNRFCEHLPESALDQAMGYAVADPSADVQLVVKSAIAAVGERLREMRLLLLHEVGGGRTVDPGLILFPEEFEHLEKGCGAFLNAAFRANPYQETPILRGLFFSSGRQEGSPFSRFLNAMGLIEATEVLPGTDRGLFLHDFFGKILPADRRLFAPTRRAVRWRSLTTNLGVISWLTLGIFVCGLLTTAFVYQSRSINSFRSAASQRLPAGAAAADLNTALAALTELQRAIVDLEQRNRGWWPPRLGLTQTERLEREVKRRFCRRFSERLLAPGDQNLIAGIKALGADSNPGAPLLALTHIMGRLTLLNDRLEGKVHDLLQSSDPDAQPSAAERLQGHPAPRYWPQAAGINEEPRLAEVQGGLTKLYVHYLLWSDDLEGIELERRSLTASLEYLLALRGANLSWLVNWVNQYGSIPAVTLNEFWGAEVAAGVRVEPAYTVKGQAMIDGFIAQMEPVLAGISGFDQVKQRFYQQYRSDYLNQWQRFLEFFPSGAKTLRGREALRQMVARIAGGEGPYRLLLQRMTRELPEPLREGATGWVVLLRRLQRLEDLIAPQPPQPAPGSVAAVVQEGQAKLDQLKTQLGQWPADPGSDPAVAAALEDYRRYQAALGQFGALPVSQRSAFELVAKTFRQDPALGDSPFTRGTQAVSALKARLGGGGPGEAALWQLFEAPVNLAWNYALNETSCQLQAKWDEMVLAEAASAAARDREKLVLGEGGLAWRFLDEAAAPFLTRGAQSGYRPVQILGEAIPFNPGWLTFLNSGSRAKTVVSTPTADSYQVGIEAKPTGTNDDARLRPRLTRLRLECGSEVQELINYQFKVARTFVWTPTGCGTVTLEIELGDTVLRKSYTGNQGFVQFLLDFPGGSHTFAAADFPRQSEVLDRYGVKTIQVSYLFRGHQDLVKKTTAAPIEVPAKIVRCWD